MAQESLSLPYITLTGAVVVTIIISFMLFRPQITEWQTTQTEIETTTAKLQERQQFLASIDQKGAQLRTQAAAEQELQVVLPAEEAFADVIRLIDRQAAAAAVQIITVDNKTTSVQTANRVAQALGNEVDVPDSLTVHGASVVLRGSYQQIRQFVGLMENAVRFMDVSDITLAQVGGQPDLLDGTVSLKFYSLSPQ